MSRNTTIVVSVVLFHIAVLWALQTGLLRRVAEVIVPAEILVEMMSPPAPAPKPQPTPQPQVRAKTPAPKPTPPTPTPAVTPQPAPAPLALAPSAVAPPATSAAPTAAPATPATQATGSAVSAPPAPPKIELPSSDADHLNNPLPVYPLKSRQLGETGTTTLRVLIGADGLTKEVRVEKSSGFDRLDQAAIAAVTRWRFVPGKRDGVPVDMWKSQAIPFVLK
ncbi:protein TonB [Rhodoferax saidenbachensis]|uniref:Protein TonB n=2 Tax=Rhodoferax saidenbachensis TaxID=1484693 RepID=A0ABU1ZHJ5_9BURK|nr:protein TonB [Rhodoferax saidenbachensis]